MARNGKTGPPPPLEGEAGGGRRGGRGGPVERTLNMTKQITEEHSNYRSRKRDLSSECYFFSKKKKVIFKIKLI